MFWLVSEKFSSCFVKCFNRRCNHFDNAQIASAFRRIVWN
jgi:hypothetical protein